MCNETVKPIMLHNAKQATGLDDEESVRVRSDSINLGTCGPMSHTFAFASDDRYRKNHWVAHSLKAYVGYISRKTFY